MTDNDQEHQTMGRFVINQLSFTKFIPVAIAACTWLTPFASAAGPPKRPNIVFVLVDDLRWDDLGCTGNTFVKSPNIDRIATEGANFRNAFSMTPLCSPSRATILTGLCAHTHGIIDNTERGKQSHSLHTFPQDLQKTGYETAFIGKWHMGNDNSPRAGFDRWYCLAGQGSTFDAAVNDNGHEIQTKGYVTDVLNEKALQFVRVPHSKPFMLYLSHKAIHPETYQGPDGKLSDPTMSNFMPAPRHKALYENISVPRRPNAGIPPTDKPALQQKIADLPPLGSETGSSDKVILNRLRMLSAVDESVGDLLKALKESGQLDNTLFVVSSDHGYFYGEHGLSIERRLAYEESIRIPLLMRFPPMIKAGSTPEAIALTIDLAPTFIDVAGGKPPTQMQGRSLVPLMKGQTPADWRHSFFVEYYSDTVFPRVHKMGYKAVRNDRWKYIHYLDQENTDEIYDLQNDPYELHNQIGNPSTAADVKAMKDELQRLMLETDAKL
jgi:N-acetylglucosamine-6-sulfatase